MRKIKSPPGQGRLLCRVCLSCEHVFQTDAKRPTFPDVWVMVGLERLARGFDTDPILIVRTILIRRKFNTAPIQCQLSICTCFNAQCLVNLYKLRRAVSCTLHSLEKFRRGRIDTLPAECYTAIDLKMNDLSCAYRTGDGPLSPRPSIGGD